MAASWFGSRRFGSLALAACLCTGTCCLAQAVTIRVLDTRGHAVAKQRVTVSLFYSRADRPANYEEDLEFTTDARGEAHFTLPEPPPEHLFVDVHLPYKKWTCICSALSPTGDLMRAGVLESVQEAPRPARAITAGPGEMVFIARQRSFWSRLLYPLFHD